MNPDGTGSVTAFAAERSLRRDWLHGALLVLPWTVLGLMWWRVLLPGGTAVLGRPSAFVAACILVTVALTAAWISHNVSIHKAKGPRTGLPTAELRYERDWVGRPVVADWTAVRSAGVVFVAGVDRHKTFVPARGSRWQPAGERPAAPGPVRRRARAESAS